MKGKAGSWEFWHCEEGSCSAGRSAATDQVQCPGSGAGSSVLPREECFKPRTTGEGHDGLQTGKRVVDQAGKKREMWTRETLVNRAEGGPPQTMHKNEEKLSRGLHMGSFHIFPGKPSQLCASLCLYTNVCSVGNKQEESRFVCSCRATVSIGSRRCGGTAHTTVVL